MVGQQSNEVDEYLLHALWDGALGYGFLLCVLQVEQEHGIEHAQDFAFVDVAGVQIVAYFAHLVEEERGERREKRGFGLVQLHEWGVGDVYQVVNGGRLDGDVFVGKQADGVVVGGGVDAGRRLAMR